MRGHARFPHFLWAEVIKAAVYLLNRTPRQDLYWDTPIHAFYTSVAKQNRTTPPEKPDLSHLKAYGCKAYAMTPAAQEQTQRLWKLQPRAWVGYLIGYDSSNIYRIWNPLTDTIYQIRDVIFDEQEMFFESKEQLCVDLLQMKRHDYKSFLEEIELVQTPEQAAIMTQMTNFETKEEDGVPLSTEEDEAIEDCIYVASTQSQEEEQVPHDRPGGNTEIRGAP
jgi:hypothetical protein